MKEPITTEKIVALIVLVFIAIGVLVGFSVAVIVLGSSFLIALGLTSGIAFLIFLLVLLVIWAASVLNGTWEEEGKEEIR